MARQHYRGRADRGRMWVVVIFAVLGGLNGLGYLVGAQFDRRDVLAMALVSFLWTTVLLIGVWRRQNWCRYILAALLILSILISIVLFPEILPVARVIPILGALFVMQGIIHSVVAWALLASPDIRRLADKP
jgi:hypothetical protein